MADFDITNHLARHPAKGKAKAKAKDKGKGKAKAKQTPDITHSGDYAQYLEKRKLLGISLFDSDSDGSDSDEESFTKRKKKPKKMIKTIFLEEEDGEDDVSKDMQDEGDSSHDSTTTTTTASNDNNNSMETSQNENNQSQTPEVLDIAGTGPSTTAIQSAVEDDDLFILDEPEEIRGIERLRLLEKQRSLQRQNRVPDPTPPPPAPTYNIPDTDLDDLDPELAMIASGRDGTPTKDAVAPQKVTIKIHYISFTDQQQLDPKAKAFIDSLTKPLKMIVMNNDPFDKILSSFCKRKLLRKDDVVLTYRNTPVVLRATPFSLNMDGVEVHVMKVYLKTDYSRKEQEEADARAARIRQMAQEEEELLKEPEKVEEERLVIRLRSKDAEDIVVRVKPSTELNSVAKYYVEQRKLSVSPEKIAFSFEGERLSLEDSIQDTELEDQDMVSVSIQA
ncbi:hypothetical protein BCR43DRAFT_485828 [Syncephalastrum racemosum]|uniref:Ubiquitin-like domain-containing protein n=1 Tax=Syncephalastrum racemosum TaxID=13706 RepID=A0A1X2HN39_SYNRA|nr:hypothetical protein BCR43DRAFT_485828 [Syncephalastrum racemosum]